MNFSHTSIPLDKTLTDKMITRQSNGVRVEQTLSEMVGGDVWQSMLRKSHNINTSPRDLLKESDVCGAAAAAAQAAAGGDGVDMADITALCSRSL